MAQKIEVKKVRYVKFRIDILDARIIVRRHGGFYLQLIEKKGDKKHGKINRQN